MNKDNSSPISVIAYHGSGCRIDQFDYAFTGIGNDQNGSGFYFTSSLQEAIAYTSNRIESVQVKPGGEDEPTVHVAKLSFARLLGCDEEMNLSSAQVRRILSYAPNLDDALADWGDIDFEGRARVLSMAVGGYKHGLEDGPIIKTLFKIANDFFGVETHAFNKAVRDVLGLDGVVEKFEDKVHYVVFFPEQIQVQDRLTREQAMLRREAQEAEAPIEISTTSITRPRG